MTEDEYKYVKSLSETDACRYREKREKANKTINCLVMGMTYKEAVELDDMEYNALIHLWNELHPSNA